jgi:DNA (cytosine-5)-methyltransferase 1
MAGIKIIDLFAGPGGLGEGFSAFKEKNGKHPFSIAVSVEKEASAHKTLQLRSFFRKFPDGQAPEEYYQYVKGDLSREALFDAFPKEAEAAREETLHEPRALGEENKYIHEQIKKALSNHQGKTIVIGGPPCQAYSLVGRARNMGIVGYEAKNDPKHFLYKEYLNILALVNPEVFVMENVKGILSSKVDDEKIFPKILNDLKCPGKAVGKKIRSKYKIYSFVKEAVDHADPDYEDSSDFIIRAEDYGIPQARHRVILLGVREDIKDIPEQLQICDKVNIEKVIDDLPSLRSGLSKGGDTYEKWHGVVSDIIKRLPSKLRKSEYKELANKITHYTLADLKADGRGARAIPVGRSVFKGMPSELKDWFHDARLKYVLNHETRGHIVQDLERYYFCASFARAYADRENPNPKSHEFPKFLAPNHKNWESGKFSDRFRVQAEGRYATTITSHISKDGHYFIHYDPLQCRSLTVREAARIQTFPDNYFFEGNRTQQYVQVGNAVPPFLANQIARVLINLFS